MTDQGRPTGDDGPLRDPEFSSAPDPSEGVSNRTFLGIPAWATAVGLVAAMAVVYLLMTMLT